VIPSFELIAYVIIAAAIYLIGGSILDHPSDIAVISSYVTYIMQLLYAIMIGSFVMSIFARGGVSLKRIKEVLETQPDVVLKMMHLQKNWMGMLNLTMLPLLI